MNKHNVVALQDREVLSDPLTEMLREGAMQLIHQAVEAELQDLLAEHAQQRTAEGKMAVVRNGYLPEREIQTGIGPRCRSQKSVQRWGNRSRFGLPWYHRM